MSDMTYWDPARKGKPDIEKTLNVNVACEFLLIQRTLFV